MADAPERPGGGEWSELEQSFFASAPPDVPAAPAEPESFDDLFPAEPRPEARRAFVARFVGNARRSVAGLAGGVGQRARLTLSWVQRWTRAAFARAWRGAGRAIGAAGAGILHNVRAVAARIVGALPSQGPDPRAIAGVASLALLMGISAAVVASRGGSRTRSLAGATAPAPRAHPSAPPVVPTPVAPVAATPMVSDVRPRTATALATGDLGAGPSQIAKRPARHRRVAAYSAERDLIVPEFMTRPSPPPPPVPAAPAPARKPFFSR